MTTADRNRATFRRYYELGVGEGRAQVLDEVLDPNVVPHTPFGGKPRGAQWIKDMIQLERRAFPDLRLTELSAVAERDRVAAHLRITATHRGAFLDFEPTGIAVAFEEMMIARFDVAHTLGGASDATSRPRALRPDGLRSGGRLLTDLKATAGPGARPKLHSPP